MLQYQNPNFFINTPLARELLCTRTGTYFGVVYTDVIRAAARACTQVLKTRAQGSDSDQFLDRQQKCLDRATNLTRSSSPVRTPFLHKLKRIPKLLFGTCEIFRDLIRKSDSSISSKQQCSAVQYLSSLACK